MSVLKGQDWIPLYLKPQSRCSLLWTSPATLSIPLVLIWFLQLRSYMASFVSMDSSLIFPTRPKTLWGEGLGFILHSSLHSPPRMVLLSDRSKFLPLLQASVFPRAHKDDEILTLLWPGSREMILSNLYHRCYRTWHTGSSQWMLSDIINMNTSLEDIQLCSPRFWNLVLNKRARGGKTFKVTVWERDSNSLFLRGHSLPQRIDRNLPGHTRAHTQDTFRKT